MRLIDFIGAAIFISGCADSDRPPSGTPRHQPGDAAGSSQVAVAVPSQLPPVSSDRLRWTPAAVKARLHSVGLTIVSDSSPVRKSFLGPEGTSVIVRIQSGDSAEVLVFIYGDAGAVAQDVAPLDTVRVSPRTKPVSWRAPAQLVTNNNLLAIVVARDSQLRQVIAKALRSSQQ